MEEIGTRRNSSSSNSQIPLTQSPPPPPPNANLLGVRPKPRWRGAHQQGSGQLSTTPGTQLSPHTSTPDSAFLYTRNHTDLT